MPTINNLTGEVTAKVSKITSGFVPMHIFCGSIDLSIAVIYIINVKVTV
jgi:hypothetical protein